MAQNRATTVNVVPNGSFEVESSVGGGKLNPEGWGFYGMTNTITGVYVLDGGKEVHSESKSVSIVGKEGTPDATCGMWLSVPIELKPGAAYSVVGWIKTSECTGKGAWLWITSCEDENGKPVGGVTASGGAAPFFTGTEDWREWSWTIYTKNIRRVRIACRLDGPGAAWFDDIQISKSE